MSVLLPLLIGVVAVLVLSLLPDRHRRKVNALGIAGAGAVYVSGGGFGVWELAFTTVMTVVAYLGLRDWRWIGAGWLLHTGWDVLHHLKGNPILPYAHDSSFGCAICDPVIALWCFAGGRSLINRRPPASVDA
ncbi:hypothetical protein Acy02nite_25650 [Actinoplanes cyaneus]|uniref:Integral membrane protein n=1 Tax=Actinoplanes cyaneus TaxID=52696 RepID=A0A919M6R9_9ACTN|nr:DUF6010 family protein [Actinoplanes cyaneus]MCW2138105.1 hypothetical protein [Actinoplanes cyaneus]GID64684.1 hypothetical protein Acy02nite_25650 [Actinoplanes cyaneus]